MKIKVLKAGQGSYWYADKIGQEFEVVPFKGDNHFDYKLVSEQSWGSYFKKDDIEIIMSGPLIGEKYKAEHTGDNKWYEVVVLSQHPENKEAYACMIINCNMLFWSSHFRPIKTEEQKQLDILMKQISDLTVQAEKLQEVINK